MANFIVVAAFVLLSQLCLALSKPGSAQLFPGNENAVQCPAGENDEALRRLQTQMIHVVKARANLWANGAGCGKVYCIKCTGAKDSTEPSPCKANSFILARVQQFCSICGTDFGLPTSAYEAIANSTIGTITVNYVPFQNLEKPCDWNQ